MPYNIILSNDPYDDVIQLSILDFGTHPYMGLILQQPPHALAPQLSDIHPGEPCGRIQKWKSTIKGAYITQINEHIITTITEVQQAIQACHDNGILEITINFSINKPVSGIHPTEGIPILFSDQLNFISETLPYLHLQRNTTILENDTTNQTNSTTLENGTNAAH
jgi:hypothetical protein